MSDIQVGIVAEGHTDFIVIESILRNIENMILKPTDRRFHPISLLQPIESDAFDGFGDTGSGWSGVYKWCIQSKEKGNGSVSQDREVRHFDLIIYHLDADVSSCTYESGRIQNDCSDLPCRMECPPAVDSVNALRTVLLGWMGEESLPTKSLICIPAHNIETWVTACLFPAEPIIQEPNIECTDHCVHFLSTQPSSARLVRLKEGRYKKLSKRYSLKRQNISDGWPNAVSLLSEAQRFDNDTRIFLDAI